MENFNEDYFNRIDEAFDMKNVDQLLTYLGSKENLSDLLKIISNVSDTAFNRGYSIGASRYISDKNVVLSQDEYNDDIKMAENSAKTQLMSALNYIVSNEGNIRLKSESGKTLTNIKECIFYLNADQIIDQVKALNGGKIYSLQEYRIGDELQFININTGEINSIIITRIDFNGEDTYLQCISTDGEAYEEIDPHAVKKTGRNFKALIDAITNIENVAR